MSGFHGKFNYSVDSKGRVNIPAKFRKALLPEAAETFFICRTPDRCLRVFPQNQWSNYVAELNSRPETRKTLRSRRLLYDTVSDSTLDSQGRITLAANQMAIAGIKSAVTLVGNDAYIELWDPTRYAAYLENETNPENETDGYDTYYFDSVQDGLLKK